MIFKFLFKGLDMTPVGMAEAALPDRIHRDQVDMGLQRPGEPGQTGCIRLAVIHIADQAVFKGDLPAGRAIVGPAGLHQFLDGPAPGDRHDLLPLCIGRSMEGQGQGNMQTLLRQTVDVGDDPAGGDRHVPLAQMHPLRTCQKPQETQQIVIIVKGLAHSHDNDMGDRLPGLTGNGIDLFEHLRGRQGTDQSVQGGRAEAASHPAPDLGGYADAVAEPVTHENTLDKAPVRHLKQEFLRPVDGGYLPVPDGGSDERIVPFQLVPQRSRQICHAGIFFCPPDMDPFKELFGPEGGLSDLQHQFFQFLREHGLDIRG